MSFARRGLAWLVCMVTALALCIPALASGEEAEAVSAPSTYTITGPNNGHTYDIYQVFTGDLAENGTLSNVKYGKNANASGTVSDDVLNAVVEAGVSGEGAVRTEVEKYADLTGEPFAKVNDGSPTAQVPAGYYLIKDNEAGLPVGGKETPYIIVVAGNTVITPKTGDTPTFEKKIKDANDTEGTVSDWQDSADWDMGDAIPFKLEGTVAGDYASYSMYKFIFHDQMEKGLTFNPGSVKVYVDGTEVTDGFTLTQGTTDGCTFEVAFADLKGIEAVHAGSKISVEYSATLNEDAVIGSTGNVNKGKLVYSNNPSDAQGGTAETPWDNVIAFTYQVVVNKVTQADDALPGAEFTLSKKMADGTTKDIAVAKNDAGTTFSFKGLDDGTYVLTETVTPSGYNTIAPITFTVTADHTITWEGERTSILTNLTGNAESGDVSLDANKDAGTLTGNVVNKAGKTLPSTGGMGTTALYAVGGVLVLVAVVLLVAKKRMGADR